MKRLLLISLLAACEVKVANTNNPSEESPSSPVLIEEPELEDELEVVCQPGQCPIDLMTAFEAFIAPEGTQYYRGTDVWVPGSVVTHISIVLANGFEDRGEVTVYWGGNKAHSFYFNAAYFGGIDQTLELYFSTAYLNSAGLVMRNFDWVSDTQAVVEVCKFSIATGVTDCNDASVAE